MPKYSTQNYNAENMARALGTELPISIKHSVEICKHIRKMKLQKAKEILQQVTDMQTPIPFTRFNSDMGHKRGMGPGRYPIKASKEILNLLNSVESNAQVKGLSTGNLIVSHICAQKAATPLHHGRQRSRSMKRTHIEIIVAESAQEKKADKKTIKTTIAIEPTKKTEQAPKTPAKSITEAKTEVKK